jgi:hypothetical protein
MTFHDGHKVQVELGNPNASTGFDGSTHCRLAKYFRKSTNGSNAFMGEWEKPNPRGRRKIDPSIFLAA